jgi:CBS-domain-containing membrane protein
MTRRDEHFDAMMRHLGAAYYQTIHGHGTAADVQRALDSAEAADGRNGQAASARTRHRSGRWRVSDVMTTDVVTVGTATSYKQVAQMMTDRKVNAMPVVTADGHVLGMVSEADVLRKEERLFRRLGTGLPRRNRRERAQAMARNAGELMTSPAITIHPEAKLGAAARLMNGHRIRRLPVVDPSGKLLGIVSRRDLLSVFLRPDEEVAAEVHGMLTETLLHEPDAVNVKARDGVVTLSGTVANPELIPVAERLASEADGVVGVICRLTAQTDSGVAPASG